MNEVYNELGEWAKKTGLHPVSDPVLTCDFLVKIDHRALEVMSFLEFEELMDKIASYNVYLKSQKCSLEAQIVLAKHELDKLLHMETGNLGADYRYKTTEEKIAVVRTIHPKIDELCRKLAILQAKLMRIKDIPFAVDKKLELLKLKYQRRINDKDTGDSNV